MQVLTYPSLHTQPSRLQLVRKATKYNRSCITQAEATHSQQNLTSISNKAGEDKEDTEHRAVNEDVST